MPGQRKELLHTKEGRFLTYTRNCKQKANIAVVKSALQILPRHNGTYLSRSKDM